MGGEKFDSTHPEGYLFGENSDLNFLGNRPVAVGKLLELSCICSYGRQGQTFSHQVGTTFYMAVVYMPEILFLADVQFTAIFPDGTSVDLMARNFGLSVFLNPLQELITQKVMSNFRFLSVSIVLRMLTILLMEVDILAVLR